LPFLYEKHGGPLHFGVVASKIENLVYCDQLQLGHTIMLNC
jgi:hypothetical protein